MITVDTAFRILQDNLPGSRHETVSLDKAYGRFLAEDITAPEPSPRFTNSAMDGYAVRWEDVQNATGAQPVSLAIAGESQAGVPYLRDVCAGEAVRISTGAVLPGGADTVVRVEDTSEQGGSVHILSVRAQGQDVRLTGEEFQVGDRLLQKGIQLGTRQLAMLAAVGISNIRVFSIPGVALLVTGTELVSSDNKEIRPFQIRDSNRVMLDSAVQEAGGKLTCCCHAGDDLQQTVEMLDRAAAEIPDLILCSGGVSVGRHDHVKKAAEKAGFAELFWRIRQKPGKPLFAARRENILLFGLPGNPVSAYMCFSHYVRPIISFLLGQGMRQKSVAARTPVEICNHGQRTNFLRVKLEFKAGEIPLITEISRQGSHMLSSITHADGYIIQEPGEILAPDTLKEVFLF
ncbi:MAG: molybdopterin molybdotransferase MoeA [Desulfobulbales bacterium]